ncbi:MAG TPA: CesT family type III secretion system chaperone [Polyangiaceae bacterium]
MRTEKDVEAYLLRLNRRYRVLEDTPGTFLVEVGEKAPPLVVRVEPPLVVVRVQLGDVPAGDGTAPMLRKLLELNAKQLVHAAYGVDDGHVVLSSALELENLDFNELQATMDEIDMALAQQISGLAAPTRKN